MNTRAIVSAAILAIGLSACGGGDSASPPPPTARQVTLTWDANRESGVNSAGGGYEVTISGQAPISVPYNATTGLTPTTTTASLYTGTYTATVRAYAALDTAGGATGSTSATSNSITIVVPQ